METQRDNESDDRGSHLSGEIAATNAVRVRPDVASAPVTLNPNGVIGIEVDRRIFDLNAVLRAAYKFTDRCYIFLQSTDNESIWLAMLRPKTSVSWPELAGDFSNELIDQRLRQSLEEQFGNLRTLIVAQAFSEGNLLDNDRSAGDYNADRRNIATPR